MAPTDEAVQLTTIFESLPRPLSTDGTTSDNAQRDELEADASSDDGP